MANWYGMSRSNYFNVRDVDAFKAWAKDLGLRIIESSDKMYGFVTHQDSDGDLPTERWDDETEDYIDIDFFNELAEHLADDTTAVVVTVGHETTRYGTGISWAVTHADGVIKCVDINDIYEDMEDDVSRAMY